MLSLGLTALLLGSGTFQTVFSTYPDEIWIKSANLQPETVVYNADDNTFYVSSFSHGTIYRIVPDNGDDEDTLWSTDAVYASDDLTSSTGFRVFNNTMMYICSNSEAAVTAWTSGDTTQINAYHGKQGQLIVVDLADPANSQIISLPDLNVAIDYTRYHFCNDIALDKEGNAYITDSFAGAIYRISKQQLNSNKKNLTAEVWRYNSEWYTGPPNFGINGIALNSLQTYLVTSVFQTGKLWKVNATANVKSGTTNNNIGQATNSLVNIGNANILSGLDGLTFDLTNDSVVYVTGNAGHTVYEFMSDDEWKSSDLHYTYTCRGGAPTAVTNVGKKDIYAINSYLFDTVKDTYLLERFHSFDCNSFNSLSQNTTSDNDDDDSDMISNKTLLGIYIALIAAIFVSCSSLITILVYIRKQNTHNMSDSPYQHL